MAEIHEMHKDPRFTHVIKCFYGANTSLSELFYLNNALDSGNDQGVVASLNFYITTLNYCFNAEYTKLLESGNYTRYPNNNIGSIFHLNQSLRNDE